MFLAPQFSPLEEPDVNLYLTPLEAKLTQQSAQVTTSEANLIENVYVNESA